MWMRIRWRENLIRGDRGGHIEGETYNRKSGKMNKKETNGDDSSERKGRRKAEVGER